MNEGDEINQRLVWMLQADEWSEWMNEVHEMNQRMAWIYKLISLTVEMFYQMHIIAIFSVIPTRLSRAVNC